MAKTKKTPVKLVSDKRPQKTGKVDPAPKIVPAKGVVQITDAALEDEDFDYPRYGERLINDVAGVAEEENKDFDFEFKSESDGKIICREVCTHDTQLVNSEEDVGKFAVSVFNGLTFDYIDAEFADGFGNPSKIHDAIKAHLIEKAVLAWRGFNAPKPSTKNLPIWRSRDSARIRELKSINAKWAIGELIKCTPDK